MEHNETLQRALKLLDRRDYSRRALLDKLLEQGAPPEAAEAAADRLEALGFLNDARYAGLVVRHYGERGYGPARIRQELHRRGVPRGLWDEALEGLEPDSEALDRLLASRLRGADLEDRAVKKRAADYLLRRGYGWEEISAAMARYLEDKDE